ncbi:arginine-tRNA ligase [Emiliania huxleyi CCMP1516]|uniref:arginine--tRNA ligase n=2 Tax=Emiliania huxleyi TaxID=2903 RepID=A0A0D3JXW7_EMIH1|nr:arginine-tRNA ligase [Emiliania huxleyi CCMP1516]EOD28352.1 arginine-tRNA ligase [Emiliania huxleyi CCMP1516]|eukprot:XP_005780781.1 arginine-tRNA ligase [Emiliania huxleyi CCMP1516]
MAQLHERLQAAMGSAFGGSYASSDPMLAVATKREFGDFQCNAALALAKPLGMKPRDAAAKLVEALEVSDLCEAPEVAGPGFLNLRLRNALLEQQLAVMAADASGRCAVPRAAEPLRTVVDYSSPNIAKEMHVGHLRSTIIGDTLARLLELRGHPVVRLNHVGDWGTQFGMLITHLRQTAPEVASGAAEAELSDLVAFYKAAKARFDAEEDFAAASRREVVALQSGDEASLAAWRSLCATSEAAFSKVYSALRVDERLVTRGESFYNPRLPSVLEDLEAGGLLQESDGARCVFLEGYTNRDGEPLPVIVQKSDGGFMYSTTDLAAIRQRVADEEARRVLYVTDAGQALHFQQVFEIARRAGFAPDSVSLEHVPFGLVQGEDGKKFKTRSGETVKLADLLDEALRRARADARLEAEGREEGEEFVARVAAAVGIGAVKYADLAMNRQSNYRFSFDKMLSLTGNTAPYMLYAYARVRGIQRRAAAAASLDAPAADSAAGFVLREPAEVNLARQLLRLGQVVSDVERDLLPSKLCEYIFELAGDFNRFYEAHLPSSPPAPALLRPLNAAPRRALLALCELTAAVLALNLRILGIEPLERI